MNELVRKIKSRKGNEKDTENNFKPNNLRSIFKIREENE